MFKLNLAYVTLSVLTVAGFIAAPGLLTLAGMGVTVCGGMWVVGAYERWEIEHDIGDDVE